MSALSSIRQFHPNPHVERCRDCNQVIHICGTTNASDVPQMVRTCSFTYLSLIDKDRTRKDLCAHTPGMVECLALLESYNQGQPRRKVCFMPNHVIDGKGEVKKQLCEECEEGRRRQIHQEVEQMFRF